MDDLDASAGRSVLFRGGEKQVIPEKDNRYRVQDSVRFYVVQLGGTWVNVSEYGERVLHRANRQSYVTFERNKYQLRREADLKPLLAQYVESGAQVYVGGLTVTAKTLEEIEPWPFIYIAPKAARDIYKDFVSKRQR